MAGEPYAWARINDKTLTVFVMVIADSGDFEIQTYNRTLTPDGGMTTEFSRIRNGKLVKSAKAKLNRSSRRRPEKNK